MKATHFIEKVNLLKKISDSPLIWETGNWNVTQEVASALVGGDVYLHTEQDAPSHFGGRVLSYREIVVEGKTRVIFQIAPTVQHKNVRTGRDGWGNEQKRVG